MDLQEALEFLDNQGYYLKENKKYKTDDEIEITAESNIDETKCPNCGEEGDCYDRDHQDNWIYDYYSCPKCSTKWRVDGEVVPKYIVIK